MKITQSIFNDTGNVSTMPFVVPNEVLIDLARAKPERDRGELSATDQAILVMILPDLCAEILNARRIKAHTSFTQYEASAHDPRTV